MAVQTDRRVESFIERGAWNDARRLIERQLSKQPENHWLLTQLGVAHYEQGQYREALRPLLRSLEVVPDCPLTLWNLAGTLDAFGKPELAVPIYAWILRSSKSPDDDPCWESREWTDSLKADCVYRLGMSFRHMGRRDLAAQCFRHYLNLLLAGADGTYSLEDTARHIRELHGNGQQRPSKAVRDAIDATLREAGIQGGRLKLPKLSLAELLAS